MCGCVCTYAVVHTSVDVCVHVSMCVCAGVHSMETVGSLTQIQTTALRLLRDLQTLLASGFPQAHHWPPGWYPWLPRGAQGRAGEACGARRTYTIT